MDIATKILHTGNEIDKHTGAVSLPIYMASTFDQDLDEPGLYFYSRSGNPTREALENIIAQLEGGVRGLAFPSGMAAISTVLLLFSPGDHLVVAQEVYGGAYRVLTKLFARLGITVTFVDACNLEKIKEAIQDNTKALYLETPSNPLLHITDLAGASELARARKLLTIVDNTFMTPYYQRPIEQGIDIVIHSATKFLGGHSDLSAGLVVTNNQDLAKQIYFLQLSLGSVLSPQDSWLLMRGIKTLKVRMDQHQAGALKIASWLKEQPKVTEVYYPGLQDHPGREIHLKQASGAGGVVSFKLETTELARHLLKTLKLPATAVSLGAVESIMSYPVAMSHAAVPLEKREQLGITANLLRFSVGLEEPQDLIDDLEQAINSF